MAYRQPPAATGRVPLNSLRLRGEVRAETADDQAQTVQLSAAAL
jgi:hypothetical protein